jgi:hypothetical protein
MAGNSMVTTPLKMKGLAKTATFISPKNMGGNKCLSMVLVPGKAM